ncbi:MAG: T9SS type A sorting domain-containing protein [Ignavibacteria bacterium]|nr:T9SS type A sorting domain-containing protein [Ignavibacteria bacterium]
MKTITVILVTIFFSSISLSQPTWNYQHSGTTNNLNRIIVKYNQNGNSLFVAGDNGTILRSSNSGLMWETVSSNTNSDLYSLEISDTDTGYAVGSKGTILRTTDGGNSWTVMSSNTIITLKEIKIMYGNIKAIATGENGTFLKLENNLWTASQIDTVDLNSITYDIFNPGRMIAVGNYGVILRSTNSGVNWSRINSNITSNLNCISGENIVVGDNGTGFQIIGTTINVFNTGTINNLYNLVDYGQPSLACGANGTVLKSWHPLITNTNQKLNSIIQTYRDNCFVTGDNGLILFTNTLNITPNAKQLNSNNISAWFKNNGWFNNHPTTFNSGFEWPKGENKYARYSSGSVIGAIVNGDTLVTVCQYGSEYLPGYTENGIPQGNGNPDYRIYKLIYDQIDSDRTEWPNVILGNSNQGAPVYYDSGSKQWKPVDYGNQTMFYSYTDSYSEAHTQYSGMTAPLKADIKQINWSFNQPEELKNIIYQEYRIINRSTNIWTNAYINLYSDDDLGSSTDDAEGVDTNLNLTYTYNKTNEDDTYGFAPPAVGFAVIRSPLVYTGNINDTVFYCEGKKKRIKTGYKEIGLGSTVIYRDDSDQPENYSENYNAIRGLQNNGTQYIDPTSVVPTKFVYSGDPVNGTGWLYPGESDARFYQGFGPLNMNPGDTQIIVIAQVIARGSSNLNSITKLRETTQTAKDFYNDCFSNVVIGINNISGSIPDDFILYQNYPNPFNPVTVIRYSLNGNRFITLKVFDALGKEVATLVNEKQSAGIYEVEFNGSNLSSGIYFYKMVSDKLVSTKKMLLLK